MSERRYSIYIHTNLVNNKVYIGQTSKKPSVRWNRGKGYAHNAHFSAAIQKYGWENFTHEILYSGLTKEEANELEISLILQYDACNPEKGYNIAYGGASNSIYRTEEEAIIAHKKIQHKAYKKMMADDKYAQKMRNKSLFIYYNNKNNEEYLAARAKSNHKNRQKVHSIRCELRALYQDFPQVFTDDDYTLAFSFNTNRKSYICNSLKKLGFLLQKIKDKINEERESQN